MSSTCPRNLG